MKVEEGRERKRNDGRKNVEREREMKVERR